MTGKIKIKSFSLGLIKEGLVLSFSYQGIEQHRRKASAFYHPEGKKSPNQRLRSCLHRAIGITINIVTFKDLADFMPLPLMSTASLWTDLAELLPSQERSDSWRCRHGPKRPIALTQEPSVLIKSWNCLMSQWFQLLNGFRDTGWCIKA